MQLIVVYDNRQKRCPLKRTRGAEMNKKSIAALLTAAVICAVLTGCGENAIPDMTDEQVKSIGEYVAITMMKYDANHRSRLVDRALLDKKPYVPPEPEATQAPSGMGTVDNTPVIDSTVVENPYTMEEVLALPDGVMLAYSGQRLYDSYPDTGEVGSIFLNASTGNRLLVLSFILSNTTGQEQKVDVLSSDAVFRVTVNGSYSRRALATGLPDDITTYNNKTIPANSDTEVVILVEVTDEIASGIESISFNVKNGAKSYAAKIL